MRWGSGVIRSVILAACMAAGIVANAAADTAELFGQATSARSVQVSPDGSRVAIGCSPSGVPAVCIYGIDAEEKPRLFQAAESQRITSYYWASDKHVIVNISFIETLPTADGVKEYDMGRAISFDLETRRSVMLMQQEASVTNLTDLASVCDVKPDKVMMELTFRAADDEEFGRRTVIRDRGFRTILYSVDLSSGRSRREEATNLSVWTHILNDECEPEVRVIYNDMRGDYRLEVMEGRRTILEYEGVADLPMSVAGFTGDKQGLVVRADHGDMQGLHTVSLTDGAVAPLTLDGETVGDLGVIKDRYRNTIVGYTYTNDLRGQMFTDPELKERHEALSGAFQGKKVHITSWSRDRARMTLSIAGPGEPVSHYLFDASDWSVSPLGEAMPQLQDRSLGAVTGFSYAARDGLDIPAYLTMPPGHTSEDGPVPLVLLPHGGPEMRDTAAFDWWAQAYAAEGYAVLQPNYRGSSGYGPAFRDAGYGEFGGAMIEDMIDGVRFLVAEGIARPEGACIVGGSYGGYAALMAPLKEDSGLGCAVAVNPVTNIFTHMARYSRDGEAYNYWARYAGGDIYAGDEARDAITPMARTSEYDIPILLLHGEDDTRVLFDQSEAFRAQWGSKPGLRFVELDGEDHFLSSTNARRTVLSESLAFLEAHHPAR